MTSEGPLNALDFEKYGYQDRGSVGRMIEGRNKNIIDLIDRRKISEADEKNLEMYAAHESLEVYQNFLNWLFATFGEDESAFRRSCVERLHVGVGSKVLITGCGFGSDIPFCREKVGFDGEVHAQDLSRFMIAHAGSLISEDNVLLTVSNALDLPYVDGYFDAVFHFGGINLFGDVRRAISEMHRVCRSGGRVVFGDESVAPSLRETDYGKIAIRNNKLWNASVPLDLLPEEALEIRLEYVLGNCFYIISYVKGDSHPYMNIDLEHLGIRGGSMRTRFYGEVEGVTASAKEKLYATARRRGISAHQLLTQLIESMDGPEYC
ncbi:MAG: methyltransferase domain-containing protein [Nitrospirae bacterium]|nr:methyltransferase domain-containing protein [Magnetococcales bacterium]